MQWDAANQKARSSFLSPKRGISWPIITLLATKEIASWCFLSFRSISLLLAKAKASRVGSIGLSGYRSYSSFPSFTVARSGETTKEAGPFVFDLGWLSPCLQSQSMTCWPQSLSRDAPQPQCHKELSCDPLLPWIPRQLSRQPKTIPMVKRLNSLPQTFCYAPPSADPSRAGT